MAERPNWGAPPAPETQYARAAEIVARPPAEAAPADDEHAGWREALNNGLMTEEDLSKIASLTPEEIADLKKPVQAKTETESPSIAAELASIDAKRRSDPVAYRKDYALQARERELFAMQSEGLVREDQRTGADVLIDNSLTMEWDKAAGVEHHLQQARVTASIAIDALPDDEAADLVSSFDELPVEARRQITRYIAIDAPSRPASDANMERFAQIEEGKELIAEFGPRAARYVGAAQTRMEMILAGMDPEQRAAAVDWFDNLSKPKTKAVLRALAGKR